jgi:predicted transcriptional regulator
MGRPGRPEVGEPINVRLDDELLRAVDAFAASHDYSRARAIRHLLNRGLAAGDMPYVRNQRAKAQRLAEQPNLSGNR